jgi:hypothetical protein
MWESVYQKPDANCMLKSFPSTFQVKYKIINIKQNDWITQRIKLSCKHTRSLYTIRMNNYDSKAKKNCMKYCRTLKRVIKGVKNQHYSRLIAKSSNKIKQLGPYME